ncbi:MAG: signal recognition particle protein [Candidatus Marinimicrobia bacterium]|jgi:signal recognition particle subunit SRP54|nr:signal recognition particle protein [Candidatus Neomarinimicrobiota bacterium]MDP6592908.1 signal recognition particle protein [Candidatus Neomarinimicrobiota bacterium]MDP6836181.1 signal recognition particle protein [Candidatus Neomarinimicrobiota bacterium]|tara:strand:+ start:4964 stop:6295 length:1332 start_codon:yes stop_codon:yes gene_type:complete
MFEELQDRFGAIVRNLRGLGKITEKNVSETGREIRKALLESDVHYTIAKEFVQKVTEKAKGTSVTNSVVPGQQFVKIVRDELAGLLGQHNEPLRFANKPPTVILMAGLQGSGKTTTAAKLASYMKKAGKKPYLVAADVYRPAAIEQLEILGGEIDVPVWSQGHQDPVRICKDGILKASNEKYDVVILDTAGRLHVDSEMMEEIVTIAEATGPTEVLFVADGMSGQDAVNSAQAFSAALEISGTILTKMDGDARGGAAVSITAMTKVPIKFIGTSEKMSGLEPFHPQRMADRILGMGDVVSLVEKAEEAIDKDEAAKMAEKLRKASFTLEDFQSQMTQMKKMGSMSELMGMIPGMGKMMKGAVLDERQLVWTDAIINSMTPKERQHPEIIDGGRRKRIAVGSGRPIQDVNRLLKEFQQMKKMMKSLSKQQPNRQAVNQFAGILN